MGYRLLSHFIFASIAAATIAATAGPAQADHGGKTFTGIYVFGDSLSDSPGNLFALSGGFEPPSPPYADGRFSNGPLWVETLAEMFDLTVDADNNRAVGGAFTDTRNSNEFVIPTAADTGILSQIARFQDDGIRIKPRDLVIVWGGSNNYLFDPYSDPETVAVDLKRAVEELANLRGRRFLVPNLPALGDTPLGNLVLGEPGKSFLNFQVVQHNAALAAMMAELREDLGVEIVVLDVHALFNGIGALFPNTSIPCLIQQPDGTRLPTGICPPDGAGSFDPAPTGTAFWDLIHPTAEVHWVLAAAARSALGAMDSMAVAESGD
jgi:outer membrane lipase/esterase